MIYIGLIIASCAVGSLTTSAWGWLTLGIGVIIIPWIDHFIRKD